MTEKGGTMTKGTTEVQNNNYYTKLLCENTSEALVLLENTETIISCNQTFLKIFNFKNRKDVIGKNLSIVHTSEESCKSFLKKLHNAAYVRKPLKIEWELSKKNGASIPCEINVSTVKDKTGAVIFSVLTIRDISQWKKYERALALKATHDPLTGFPNRVLFIDRLALALVHAQRNKDRLAVLFFDLDSFKEVNYKYGYNVGDLLLKETGSMLKKYLRKGDTVGRFGDDEYVILLPGIVKKEGAAFVAEKLLKAFHSPITIDGHKLSITASIGIALFPEDGETHEELVKNADIAMFFVKKMGRDNFQFYSAVTM
jgi:diguanylate cyclase (GGDEF)-like protein/PAS domain S-box-containing protein